MNIHSSEHKADFFFPCVMMYCVYRHYKFHIHEGGKFLFIRDLTKQPTRHEKLVWKGNNGQCSANENMMCKLEASNVHVFRKSFHTM